MSVTQNETLLAAIRGRESNPNAFNYGIGTADAYVKTLQDCIGLPACYKYAAAKNVSFADSLKRASNTLVYGTEDMLLDEVEYSRTVGSSPKMYEDIVLPKNTLMVFRHTLTSPRKDRDGDILRTQGAQLDQKMLLLWQHVHTLPIGKLLAIHEHNAKHLKVISCIVDMSPLAHDAAVMIDNDMGRFSHGFRALEFTEMKAADGMSPGGFDVKRFEIMEESLVSVPSNVDSDTDEVMLSLIEGGKMTSPLMKDIGKSIRGRRSIRVPVTVDLQLMLNGKEYGKSETKCACGCGGEGPCKPGKAKPASEETDGDDDEAAAKAAGGTEVTTPGHIEFPLVDDKAYGRLDNSWEDVQSELGGQAKSFLIGQGVSLNDNSWIYVVGTYPDHVILCAENGIGNGTGGTRYYRVGWTTMDGRPKLVGEAKEVDLLTTVSVVEKRLQLARVKSLATAPVAVIEPIEKASKPDAHDVEDGEDEECPECGDKMKNGVCKQCGYKAPVEETDKSAAVNAAMSTILALATVEQRVNLQKTLAALNAVDEQHKKVDDYLALTAR